MKDAKASIEEAIQVLEDAGGYEGLLRASGTAMGLLGNALAVLESEEVLVEGWAMPERAYYAGPHTHGCDWKSKYERQIRVYLDRAPKGSRRVRIVKGE